MLEVYQLFGGLFFRFMLNVVEQNVVWLIINVEYNCYYCVLVYIGIVYMQGVVEDVINVLCDNCFLLDEKFEVLCQFMLSMLCNCGIVEDVEVEVFLVVGYICVNIFDVVLGLLYKVLLNYVNYFVDILVDECFQQFDWVFWEIVVVEQMSRMCSWRFSFWQVYQQEQDRVSVSCLCDIGLFVVLLKLVYLS